MAFVTAGLIAYAIVLRIGPVELLRCAAGLCVLWGPINALAFVWLRDELPDRLPRATFATAAGYALTSLLYFGCGVVAGTWLFYPVQLAIVATAVVVAWRLVTPHRRVRVRPERSDESGRGSGWVLAALVVVSLLVLSRYQIAERVDAKTGDVHFVAHPEQTYFVGQAYELARHTPPVQQACQAGVPERAYHLLSHVTAMLIARFGGVSDIMRAHLVYHYAFITVLLCLALYSIAWRITGTRVAGYIVASLLVILEIPLPPAVPSPLGHFYFNLFPLATSVLQPTVITSPQMYGGLVPTFAVLLGVVYLCHGLQHGRRVGRLAIVCAALVAATSRFRVQVFLPLAPGFMLVLAYAWWRSRGRDRWSIAVAGAVAVALSGLLYAEVHAAYYLRNTATLEVGFHPNYRPMMDAWPGSAAIADFLRRWLLPDKVSVVFSVLSIVGFTLLNVIGVPSLLAGAAWLVRPRTWRDWGPYAGLTAWLIVASILGAITIRVGYDDYSVGGQMLLDTGWYALPLLAVVLGAFVAWAMRWVMWPAAWAVAGVIVIAGAGVYQAVRPDDKIERMTADRNIVIPRNDWLAIQFLRKHTPAGAVILSDHHLEPNAAVYPGLAGRSAYVAYVRGTTEVLPTAAGTNAGRSRPQTIDLLWRETNRRHFASLLASTRATYLVEYSDHPLKVRPHRCLKAVWVSPPAAHDAVRVRVFQVLNAAKGPGPS